MTAVVKKSYSPLVEAAQYMLRFDKPRPGSTQKEAALQVARFASEREGIYVALSWLATQERVSACEHFPTEAWIEAVDSYKVRGWWLGIQERWEDDEWKDKSDEAFYSELVQSWVDEIILGEGMKEKIEARRRELILAGEIAPTEADRTWIIEERAKLSAVVDPYDTVLSKLS